MCLYRIVREGMGYLWRICWSIESGQDRSEKEVMQACLHEPPFCEWPMRRKPRNRWCPQGASGCHPDGLAGCDKEIRNLEKNQYRWLILFVVWSIIPLTYCARRTVKKPQRGGLWNTYLSSKHLKNGKSLCGEFKPCVRRAESLAHRR